MPEFDQNMDKAPITRHTAHLPYTDLPDAEGINSALESVSSYNFLEKLDAFSYSMVAKGVPYKADPWGESYAQSLFGEGISLPDKDPLFSFSGLDCVTYVLSVIASASSQNAEEYERRIVELNYIDGKIAYENRRHFVETDFVTLPYISEVTKSFMPNAPSTDVTINRIAWLKNKSGFECTETNDICYIKDISVPYIPFIDFLNPELQAQLPDFLFFAVIGSQEFSNKIMEKYGTGLAVAHTGFIVRKGNEIFVRHAGCVRNKDNKCTEKKVFEETLESFVNGKTGSSMYLGLALYTIDESILQNTEEQNSNQ